MNQPRDVINPLFTPPPTPELQCKEGLDAPTPTPTPTPIPQDVLRALMDGKKPVNNSNMLAETCIVSNFEAWVASLWELVKMMELDDPAAVGYTTIRTFGVVLASTPEHRAWPLLKWERYASLWIAIKLHCSLHMAAQSVPNFLTAIYGPGTFLSEHTALLTAERRVLDLNNFAVSSPLATDFAGVCLDIMGASDSVRHSTFQRLKKCSYKIQFVSTDPLLAAVACIQPSLPLKWESLHLSNLSTQISQVQRILQ